MPDAVGRHDVVTDVLAEAAAGRSAAVLAPPGGGLSTVLQGVAAEARRSGHEVRFVRFPDSRFEQVDLPPGALLIADDAHRADDVQLLELRDNAVDGRTVLGVRTGAAPDALSWLWRSGVAMRRDLSTLDASSVESIVEQLVGGPVHRALIEATMKRSCGRPGFVVDEIESMRDAGAIVQEAGFVRHRPKGEVGGRLVERARYLLEELPDDVAMAVTVVAVAGTMPFGAVEAFAIDVNELVRRQLVDPVEPPDRLGVRIVPPALDSAVRAAVSPAHADELAKRILDSDVAELCLEDDARLRLQIGAPLDLDRITAAAWTAVRDRSLTDAVVLARSAAGCGPAGVMVAAEVLTNVGSREEAAAWYSGLLGDDEADGSIQARAAIEYASLLLWDLGRPGEAVDIAATLTNSMRGGSFADVALIHEAAITMYTARPRAALDLVADIDPAVVDDDSHRVLTLVRVVSSAFVCPAIPAGDDIRELTSVSGVTATHSFGPAVGVIAVELAFEFAGQHVEAAEVVAAARRDPRLDGTPVSIAWLALAEARCEIATGRPARAKRAALEAAACFADINHPSGLRWAVGGALLASAMVGDPSACRTLSAELDSLAGGASFLDADLLRARAWAAWTMGSSSVAATLFAEAAEQAAASSALTLEAVALHDAHRLLGSSVRDRLDALARESSAPSIVLRARHVRLRSAGDPVKLLELAADFEHAGALLLAAEVAGDAVAAATAQGRRSTTRQATAHQARLAGLCGDPATPGVTDRVATALTNRERDIAMRAADGRSSKLIADELGLSVRTVDNVLQRVYVKLGLHRRSELSSRMATSTE